MKKFYQSIIVALMAMVAINAGAWTVTLSVDNPDAIDFVQWEWLEVLPGDDGVYTLSSDEPYASLGAYAKTERMFKGATCTYPGMDEPEDVSDLIRGDKVAFEAYPTEEFDGAHFQLYTQSMADMYDMSITVNVDIPEAIEISTAAWRDIHFIKNTTVVPLSSEMDLPISISSYWEYEGKIYEVKHNGVPVEAEWGSYEITPADGDIIDVTVTFPDIDVPVTLTHLNPAAADGFWLTLNYGDKVEVTPGFTVKAGNTLSLNYDSDKYQLVSLTVNEEPINEIYGSYDIDVLNQERIDIVVELAEYDTHEFTLFVDDAKSISVYEGYSTTGESMPLVDGENHLTYHEGQYSTSITITANSGYNLISIFDGEGNDLSPYEGRRFRNIDIKPGMVLYVVAEPFERDSKLILYMQGTANTNDWSYFYRKDRQSVAMTDGYQVVEYNSKTELPLEGGFYNSRRDITIEAYLNDQYAEPEYEGGSSYQFPCEIKDWDTDESTIVNQFNGTGIDVLKFYIDTPVTPTIVCFEFEDFADEDLPAITTDLLIPVEYPEEGIVTLPGTQVDVVATTANILSIELNGIALEANEDGTYTFIAEAPSFEGGFMAPAVTDGDDIDPGFGVPDLPFLLVSIKAEPKSGIENVAATAEAAIEGIYNLQGIRIKADRNALPAGIYVINGQKVVVK